MSKKKPTGIKLIAVLSDIHAGSTKALLPPGFVTSEGNEILLNHHQEWLWECWEEANKWLRAICGDDDFALVLNGDMIEGCHHGTKEIISPSVGDHTKAAIEILGPLTKRAAKTFMVRGTECHVGGEESLIAHELNCSINPDSGTRVFDRLVLDLNGIRHVFRHHIGTSVRRATSGSQLSVQLSEEQVEAANNNEKIPQVLCCAHRHKFGFYQDDNGLCVVSPPWQVLTRFGHKVVSQARTKPGLYILDYRGCEFEELPEVRSITFKCPEGSAVGL